MSKQNMCIVFQSSLLSLCQNHSCSSGHQIQYVIYIVFCWSQELLQAWNIITYFTDRQSFPKSKALIYYCENSAFCRKMVSSFSLIITWITDSKLSLASWISVKREDVLFAWEVRKIHLFIMTWRKHDIDKTVKRSQRGGVTVVRRVYFYIYNVDIWQQLSRIMFYLKVTYYAHL